LISIDAGPFWEKGDEKDEKDEKGRKRKDEKGDGFIFHLPHQR